MVSPEIKLIYIFYLAITVQSIVILCLIYSICRKRKRIKEKL